MNGNTFILGVIIGLFIGALVFGNTTWNRRAICKHLPEISDCDARLK